MLSQLDRPGKRPVLEWSMPQPWWKDPRKLRHARVLKDVHVKTARGPQVLLKKGSFISPVRLAYLPNDHFFKRCIDETSDMVADTPVGIAAVSLEDVEW